MKKNFNRIPPQLLKKSRAFSGPFVVACVKKISRDEIGSGKWSHLGISLDGADIRYHSDVLPLPTSGRYSRRNVEGHEVIHKDLPKIWKSFTWEVPDFGDWSNGSHDITMDREVYQRTFYPPRLIEISVERVAEEATDKSIAVFRFRVNEVVDPSAPDYEDRFLFNLNLLQENVFRCDVYSASATLEDYLRSVYEQVGWEILPPGKRDLVVAAVLSKIRQPTEEVKRLVEERYDFLAKLQPEAFVHGLGGFERYFGAKFSDSLVVFENLQYGNAIYVMRQNWLELSKLSRRELLKGSAYDFDRIVHAEGWQARLLACLKRK